MPGSLLETPPLPRTYTRIHRLLRIVNLIQSRRGLNAARLAEACETTERNIYRDMKMLEGAGVPVSFSEEEKGYRITGDFFMPPVALDLEEALALVALGESAGRDQLPMLLPAARAIEKVRGRLPRKLIDAIGAIAPHIEVRMTATQDGAGHADVYERMRQAIANRLALRCCYEAARNTGESMAISSDDETFLFKPYCLFFGQRAWYAVGWRSDRDELRTLKLSRFSRCETTDVNYQIPPGFSLRKHLGNAWRMMGDGANHRVELHFLPPHAETVAETHWHDTQDIENHDDGSITFRCTVAGLEEIVWWILGYGPFCKVIKPKQLAQRARELIHAAAEQYDE